VQQGCGVNKFDRGGEADMVVAAIVAQARAGQCEQGPQALAAGCDQMSGELWDQRHFRLHMVDDELVDPRQIGRTQIAQRVQRRRFAAISDAR